MISVHFDGFNPVYAFFNTAKNGDNETFKHFFHGLLKRGVYIRTFLRFYETLVIKPETLGFWFITKDATVL